MTERDQTAEPIALLEPPRRGDVTTLREAREVLARVLASREGAAALRESGLEADSADLLLGLAASCLAASPPSPSLGGWAAVGCPACGARPGSPCTSGLPCPERADAALGDRPWHQVPCARCGSGPGSRCVPQGFGGPLLEPHAERLEAARRAGGSPRPCPLCRPWSARPA
jgi:hypothetical protein